MTMIVIVWVSERKKKKILAILRISGGGVILGLNVRD